MPGNEIVEKETPENNERYCTENDYWSVKRTLEAKAEIKQIFANPKRYADLKKYILAKNQLKDDLTKVATDDAYGKALGV
ncbi:MAG: hypothetical protein RBT59_13280 [Arcobacteraceae bacterium]|jgi:hypothetical protein|nr:hypothetical protein [Arcobacteraceae bacterium]